MRPVRMANFFQRAGLKTMVLCGGPSSYEGKIDWTLDDLVGPDVDVVRADLEPPIAGIWGRLLTSGYTQYTDDVFARWRIQLRSALNDVLRNFRPDFVILTLPPFSLHRIMMWPELRQIPVVVDFRDAWSHWTLTPYATYFHYLHRLYCERATLARAGLGLVTSKVTLDDLASVHGDRIREKLLYIPNTFDEYSRQRFQPIRQDRERLELLYLGSFYYNPDSQRLLNEPWYRKRIHQWLQYAPRFEDWSYRGPERLLRILDKALVSGDGKPRFKVTFAGKRPDWWESLLRTDRLRSCCTHLGFIPKAEAMERLQNADALLLTSSKVLGGDDYSIAGKTFEYLASRKPIIGFVCPGAQRDLLEESGVALCLDPDDTSISANRFNSFLAGEIQLKPNETFIESHKTNQVLAKLLLELESLFCAQPN